MRRSTETPAPSPRSGFGCALATAVACLPRMGRSLTVRLAALHIASHIALAAIVFPASRRHIIGPTQPTQSISCVQVPCSVAEDCAPFFFVLRGQAGEGGGDIDCRGRWWPRNRHQPRRGCLRNGLKPGTNNGNATGRRDGGGDRGRSNSDPSADQCQIRPTSRHSGDHF